MMLKTILKYFILSSLVMTLAACGDDDKSQPAPPENPHTGNDNFEQEESPDASTPPFQEVQPPEEGEEEPPVEDGFKTEKRYVHTTGLRVRSSTDLTDISNVLGKFSVNDEVLILSDVLENDMVQIEVLKSNSIIQEADEYYTSIRYLSLKPQTRRVQTDNQYRYFMVQNIATEKMRVYEKRCGNGACAHHMVFEGNIAVGEYQKKKPGLRSIVGSFHIDRWVKFYQDNAGRYPSWYHPDYPMPPKPGKGIRVWAQKKYRPYKGAKVRGAFGWYTAFPGPDARYQWTHGTLGWGADKDKFIKVTRDGLANFFADPRSHGCTRIDNEGIAYLRSLLPAGTPLIKIYAKEAYADPNLSDYTVKKSTWDYILTKNGSRVNGEEADREVVLANGTPRSQYLEEGTYEVDLMPTAKKFTPGKKNSRNGKNGNVYRMQEYDMNGVFLVDAGTLVNYKHPNGLVLGGYKEVLFPEYMLSQSDEFTLPTK